MADIRFHSLAESAYLWSAMHVADEKGVSYEVRPFERGSPEHLALHPFGKMPVLQHGELVLYETAAIVHYIDGAFEGPPLQPATAAGQAHVLRWISIVNAYVFPVMNRFMKERLVRPAFGFEPDHSFLAEAREPLRLQVRLMDEAIRAGGFLVGDQLTIADSFLFPHLLFFARTPEGAALLDSAPSARAWLTRLQGRPSYIGKPMSAVYEAFGHFTPNPREQIRAH